MNKSMKPAAVRRAKTRDRAAQVVATKGLSHGSLGRAKFTVKSPAEAFRDGFVGSFKLVADTFRAVKSAGGRFLHDEDSAPPRMRTRP
jgi:hypothetical protein